MRELMAKLEAEYGFKIKKMKTIKFVENSSFVAKVLTKSGEIYALKSLFIEQDRQRFITETEKQLAEKGVKLARPIPTQNNHLSFEFAGAIYVLYEWVNGKSQSLGNVSHLLDAVTAIAKFHKRSSGLAYPSNTTVYAHDDWVMEYKRRLKTMKNWKKRHRNSQSKAHGLILQNIPFFYKLGRAAKKYLKKSDYGRLASLPYSKQSLVHGDFHQNNLIKRGRHGALIDLEDVRYDFPSKDLIRIYSMYMRSKKFKEKDFRNMMRKYKKINPLPSKVNRVVMTDLLFPHIFEHMLRKKKYERMSYDQVKHLIDGEKKKGKFIHSRYFRKP